MSRFIAQWMWGDRTNVRDLRDALKSETRKIIVAMISKNPMTVTQLADSLNLSRTAVYNHIKDMEHKGLIKTVEPTEKQYKVEKYYELNVPFCTWEDRERIGEVVKQLREELSTLTPQIAEISKKYEKLLIDAFDKTSLKEKGYTADDVWIVYRHEANNAFQDFIPKPFSSHKKPWGYVLVEWKESEKGSAVLPY